MSIVIDQVEGLSAKTSEKHSFHVLLGFKKPNRSISFFFGDGTSGCGVYAALAEIFQRSPEEIYEAMCNLAFRHGNGFMQEYLTLEDASAAVAKASLFAHKSCCSCFLIQEAHFFILEVKK